MTKTKLAILAFLCCGENVKIPTRREKIIKNIFCFCANLNVNKIYYGSTAVTFTLLYESSYREECLMLLASNSHDSY